MRVRNYYIEQEITFVRFCEDIKKGAHTLFKGKAMQIDYFGKEGFPFPSTFSPLKMDAVLLL